MGVRIPRYWKRKLSDKKQQLFDIYYEAYELSPAQNDTKRKKLWNKTKEKTTSTSRLKPALTPRSSSSQPR